MLKQTVFRLNCFYILKINDLTLFEILFSKKCQDNLQNKVQVIDKILCYIHLTMC